jgi:predicted transcriptional regulator
MSTRRDIEKVKEFALGLYLQNTYSQKEIAEIVGASENSVSTWAKGGKWEKLRESTILQRNTQITALYNQLSAINAEIKSTKGYPDSKQANIIKYLTKSIKDLERESSIAQVFDLSVEMINYFNDQDTEIATNLRSMFDQYMEYRAKKPK